MLVCNTTGLLVDIEDLFRGCRVEIPHALTKRGTQSTRVVLRMRGIREETETGGYINARLPRSLNSLSVRPQS